MTGLHLLFDGWPLVYEPLSPAALHAHLLMACLPGQVKASIALPGETPWSLPGQVSPVYLPTPDIPQKKLAWEQVLLPRVRREVGASFSHLTRSSPSLLDGANALLSPAAPRTRHEKISGGIYQRLGQAFSQGGVSRLEQIFLPADLPADESSPVTRLPPVVPPGFKFSDEGIPLSQIPALPEKFILAHSLPDRSSLEMALVSWTWVAGPLGTEYPLVLVGLPGERIASTQELIHRLGLEESVRLLPEFSPDDLPAVYRQATALLHPADAGYWSSPLRLALAAGLPIVSINTPHNSALAGPAGFLCAPDQPRAIGAALISVIVQENLAADLRSAALERSSGWDLKAFCEALTRFYATLVKT